MGEKAINNAYGSIPHLPTSQVKSDKVVPEGQKRIATKEKRDDKDKIVVQIKLDGSCVGVIKKGYEIIPVIRSGYRADDSNYRQHHTFADWVYKRQGIFDDLLEEGQRVMGEWLLQAHGTKYNIVSPDFLFRPFDLIDPDGNRLIHSDFRERVEETNHLSPITDISWEDNEPVSVEQASDVIDEISNHLPPEPETKHEGAVWRVEREGEVDYLCKWVRPDKEDGKYLAGLDCNDRTEPVWNYDPNKI
jgi:hypothetical protein